MALPTLLFTPDWKQKIVKETCSKGRKGRKQKTYTHFLMKDFLNTFLDFSYPCHPHRSSRVAPGWNSSQRVCTSGRWHWAEGLQGCCWHWFCWRSLVRDQVSPPPWVVGTGPCRGPQCRFQPCPLLQPLCLLLLWWDHTLFPRFSIKWINYQAFNFLPDSHYAPSCCWSAKGSNNIHSEGQILLMNKLKFKQWFKFTTSPWLFSLIRVIHVTFPVLFSLLLLFKLFINTAEAYLRLPTFHPDKDSSSYNPILIWQLL